MPAYLLLLVAVLTRVIPHAAWLNFTAIGGALLYFGARRPWREMLAPLAVLAATDVYLTTFTYHYAFHWAEYVPTWTWYLAAIALGNILLRTRTSWLRFGTAVVLGPTSFFLMSNFAVWLTGGMYPMTSTGLKICYIAGLPFYGRDLASTALVAGIAFGVPVLVRRLQHNRSIQAAGATTR